MFWSYSFKKNWLKKFKRKEHKQEHGEETKEWINRIFAYKNIIILKKAMFSASSANFYYFVDSYL